MPNYWVVSPNLNPREKNVEKWKAAIKDNEVAFMGWPDNHPIGHKFVTEITPDDVILIARRTDHKHETVGYGRVVGKPKKRLKDFPLNGRFKALLHLDPFIRNPVPRGYPQLSAALTHTKSLRQLHPEWKPEHEKLCRWMDKKLESGTVAVSSMSSPQEATKIKLSSVSSNGKRDYKYATPAALTRAVRREDALVKRYIASLKQEVLRFSVDGLFCDIFDDGRKNLIEAKAFIGREYIRMAVGQLFDYEFKGKAMTRGCHKAILLPSKPDDEILRWLKSIDISVVWEDGSEFHDNASGQFTKFPMGETK